MEPAPPAASPARARFDLPAFLGHVLTAGYPGPLSLEVFNDVFRQSDPRRAAVDALRSLLALRGAPDRLDEPVGRRAPPPAPPTPQLGGYAFTELGRRRRQRPVPPRRCRRSGFAHTGQHRSKPVQLWEQGEARVLLNADRGPNRARAPRSRRSASRPPTRPGGGTGPRRCCAPACRAPARAGRGRPAPRSPHRTAPRCSSAAPAPGRAGPADFGRLRADRRRPGTGSGITHVDHVALTQPFDHFDEAALFYRSVLGLGTQHASEVAAPFGLVRNRAVSRPAPAPCGCA